VSGLLALAFGAGLLAPVNPCGFALLPAYLTTFLQDAHTSTAAQRLRRALGTGVAVTLGFSATLTAVGIALAAGLRALTGVIPWLAAAVGLVLALVGLAMLLGRDLSVRLPRAGAMASAVPKAGRWRLVGFGVGYALASASCTLGILLAVVGAAVAAGSLASAAAVFAAYAAGSAILLLALAVAAAVANTALTRAVSRVARYLPRIAGALLAASGIYLIVYWAPALFGGTGTAPANPLTRVAAQTTTWISAHQTTVLALAGAVLAAGALAAILATRRRQPAEDCCDDATTPPTRTGPAGRADG
jgi:cytochrome c-type biogenesis protein